MAAEPEDAPEQQAQRLRDEVEELVRRARLLLHGEHPPEPPKSPAPDRAERERELGETLEKADTLQREIKRMRAELASRDHMGPLKTHAVNGEEKDPQELQNRMTERRRELRRLRKQGEALDAVAERQQQAEAANNTVSPAVQEKLQAVKREVDQQKKSNAHLQSERLKLSSSRKAAEKELRAAGNDLRSKAALLQKPAGAAAGSGAAHDSSRVRQLRHELDVLEAAAASDERRIKAQQESADRGVERAEGELASLRDLVAEREAELQRLQEANGGGELKTPRASAREANGGGELKTPRASAREPPRTPAEVSPG